MSRTPATFARRTILLGGLAALATGCADEPAQNAGLRPTLSPGVKGEFPATVVHAYGETTIPAEPQRVVSVGLTEHDILLQLGIVPVAVTEWYGEQPSATWPWSTDLLEGAEPTVLSTDDGFAFEEIAGLQPDLIIGVNAGMKQKDYDLLSKIAPTVANPPDGELYFSPWDEQVQLVTAALGRPQDGYRIIAEVKDAYDKVASEHPDWEGLTATFSQGAPYDGILYVYPDGLNTEFLTYLGFTMNDKVGEFSPEAGYQAEISAENVYLLEADIVVFATESEDNFDDLLDWSTTSRLDAVKENRSVYTDETLAGAIYFMTPASLLYTLETLTPMLESAVKGKAPRSYPG